MRKRFVSPVFWQDEHVVAMTRDERLMFIGMVTIADDEGCLVGSPAHLLGSIFPYDDVTVAQVKEWRDSVMAKNPNVVMYTAANREYIYFRTWKAWQNPSHPTPSKLPQPPRELMLKGVQTAPGTVRDMLKKSS